MKEAHVHLKWKEYCCLFQDTDRAKGLCGVSPNSPFRLFSDFNSVNFHNNIQMILNQDKNKWELNLIHAKYNYANSASRRRIGNNFFLRGTVHEINSTGKN